MTYLQFHFVFILPAVLLLGVLTRRDLRLGLPLSGNLGRSTRFAWRVLLAHVLVALAYTTPRDNYLVAQGIWAYGEDRVLFTLGYVPIEEYLFFVLQPVLTGLLIFTLARRVPVHASLDSRARARVRALGSIFWLVVAAVGVLALGHEHGTYLGLILVWAAPVLAFQWGFGGDFIVERARVLLPGVALATLYLWLADRLAIAWGIWWISPEHSTELGLLGLPLEEALFFLITNLLIAFGLALTLHPGAWPRALRLRAWFRAPWRSAFVLWALIMIPAPLVPGAFAPIAYLSTAFLALGVLGYALSRYGAKAWRLFGVIFAFGLMVEWLGSRTGIPFGAYGYSAPGPHLFGVPLLVPLGWWAFTMIAFAVSPAGLKTLFVPLALVAWDLGLDPLMVAMGFWRFDAGGIYHGVPLSNFLGWALSGLLLATLLMRLEPRLQGENGLELRLVFVAQAFLMSIGLVFFGLELAAMVTLLAMGLISLSAWRAQTTRAPLGSPE